MKRLLDLTLGIVTSIASALSGAIYARHGQGVYYLMAERSSATSFSGP